MQRIGDVPAVFSLIDLGDLPAAARAARAAEIALEVAKRPFDLAQGPLWRITLLRAADEEHVIVIVMHHIVSDAWSFYVFGQELAEFYEASVSGRPPASLICRSSTPISASGSGNGSPARFSSSNWLTGEPIWKEMFPGCSCPPIDPDRSRRTIGERFRRSHIPATVARSLGQLSKRETATMFMTLMAGFEVLLHQYSGQKDMVLCTPASGRHRSQTKELIGYFNNILPMRFNLEGDPTFVEVVRRTRRVSLDSFKYQDLPFQVIADFPNLKAVSLSRVLFSLDIEWPPRFTLPGLATEAWAVRTETADFDLSVSLWLSGEEIHGVFEYKSELFDDDTIARMIGRLLRIADGARRKSRDCAIVADGPCQTRRRAALRHPPDRRPSRYRPSEFSDRAADRQGMGGHPGHPAASASTTICLSSEQRPCRSPGWRSGSGDVRRRLSAGGDFPGADGRVEISALIRSGGGGFASSALAPIQPVGTLPPLFLCEGIGVYYPLVHHLGKEQPVYGLITEVAGNFPRVEDLAASYVTGGPGVTAGWTVLPRRPVVRRDRRFRDGPAAYRQPARRSRSWPCSTPRRHGPSRPSRSSRRVVGHLNNLRRFGFRYVEKRLGRRFKRIRQISDRRMNRSPDPRPKSSPIPIGFDTFSAQPRMSINCVHYAGRTVLFVLAGRDGMSDSLFDPAMGHIDPQARVGPDLDGRTGGSRGARRAREHVPRAKREDPGREIDVLPGNGPRGGFKTLGGTGRQSAIRARQLASRTPVVASRRIMRVLFFSGLRSHLSVLLEICQIRPGGNQARGIAANPFEGAIHSRPRRNRIPWSGRCQRDRGRGPDNPVGAAGRPRPTPR